MKMVKLVSESLQENVYDRLNEQMNAVSESVLQDFLAAGKKLFGGLNAKYDALDKKNEKAIREFAWLATVQTYVANNPEAGKKALKLWCEKIPVETIQKYLEEAAKSKFAGRTTVSYVEKKPVVGWKDVSTLNLANQFKGGGTNSGSGSTSFG